MTKCDPSWTVDRINRYDLQEIRDGLLVLSVSCTIFRQTIDAVYLILILVGDLLVPGSELLIFKVRLLNQVINVADLLTLDHIVLLFLILGDDGKSSV